MQSCVPQEHPTCAAAFAAYPYITIYADCVFFRLSSWGTSNLAVYADDHYAFFEEQHFPESGSLKALELEQVFVFSSSMYSPGISYTARK
eukprot:1142668-Pelagomonas_calceolata.AAC.3